MSERIVGIACSSWGSCSFAWLLSVPVDIHGRMGAPAPAATSYAMILSFLPTRATPPCRGRWTRKLVFLNYEPRYICVYKGSVNFYYRWWPAWFIGFDFRPVNTQPPVRPISRNYTYVLELCRKFFVVWKSWTHGLYWQKSWYWKFNSGSTVKYGLRMGYRIS